MFEDRWATPVLVGGGAVELFTGGAYTTGDFDFVGELNDAARVLLQDAGFRKTGRHWKHEGAQIFIEFPGRSLEPGVETVELDAFANVVLVISPEDALVDRLAAWKSWKSEAHGVNAYLLYLATKTELDWPRLEKRGRTEHVMDALLEVTRFAETTGGELPTESALTEWARRYQ
ncbi:MAG TPA: hypothetical protein VFH11_01945 [Gemmatimonadota bacterium]|nr:hypothetical protein [Gemmatimonadota bacterium]